MTIERHATLPATTERHDEIVQFVFRSAVQTGLLQRARAMLDAAPKELAESFEQAVRAAGLAS
ncbi:hypothetical protein [Scleromatobacter humisilvae]|uniref:Uncharacterized protein n=1 Tax=Scleromatobacter humisilvae TaxID=2897159 RepID=A0A9X1YPI2_9BURK|nr:hypothetical protein [Scleromatobacter humisilvae]MCK9688252.1 hypothetical protein [Scleromatobacter humisilvae]